MEKVIVFLALLLLSTEINSQSYDSVIKKDGTAVQGKVLKVTDQDIELDPKGTVPFIIIKRNEVESILYSDGTFVKMNNTTNSASVQDNSSVPKSLQFVDKNSFPLRELVIIDQKFATTTYALAEMGGTVESEEFYSDPDKTDIYKMSVHATWSAQGSVGKLFSKEGATIYCQSLTYTVTILKNEVAVFSRTFSEPNFNFKIIRALIQGREQTVEGSRVIPDFVSDKNTFSFGGIVFTAYVKFWDGTYIWEPNTRIGDAYLTYRTNIKILISQ